MKFAVRKTRARFTSALWVVIATMLFVASAQPSASGLDFPTTTRLTLPQSSNLVAKIGSMNQIDLSAGASLYTQLRNTQNLFATQVALVASVSRQVEMARTASGARQVGKQIMKTEYNWGDKQFTCLNRLWSKESNWNYKAHNYRSGAHGIPQSLPANKMEVVSSDWRTNPVTQIRWGLRYVEDRYKTPCAAWSKFLRSRYY
jgi:hypothetical protein